MNKNFNNLTSTFKNSIKTWEYFVNWRKVFDNKAKFEITLNKLNYLLGKEDLKSEFIKLYESNPDIIKVIPVLLAIRGNKFEIFSKDSGGIKVYDISDDNPDPNECFKIIENSGLRRLFQKDGIKNLVDYVIGVEVGLDSNGRKNRTGTMMEEIVDTVISDLCRRKNLEYMKQARPSKINEKYNIKVNVDKSERSFDFAIYNPKSKKIKLLETNFYSGGGSKLKAVCGEFKSLYNELEKQDIDFIWVTDGLGWRTALKPLEEVFNQIDYIFNLSMLESRILDELEW